MTSDDYDRLCDGAIAFIEADMGMPMPEPGKNVFRTVFGKVVQERPELLDGEDAEGVAAIVTDIAAQAAIASVLEEVVGDLAADHYEGVLKAMPRRA